MYRNTKTTFRRFSARPRGGRRGRSSSASANPSSYIKKAVETADQQPIQINHKFTDFGLEPMVVERVTRRGFVTPTPIQDQAIEPVMAGRDVIGIAETGTGKTAAFVLPLLNKCLRDRSAKVLIIVPTRELALQIGEELRLFAAGLPIYSAMLIGGSGYSEQIRALRNRPQFIIGTPGRLKDHLNRGTMRLADVGNLVLDEADRMVEMGFINDVRTLVSKLAQPRQSLFFSATIGPEVTHLINTFLHDPVTISVKRGNTSDNIDQDVVHYTDNFQKLTKLHDVLIQPDAKKVLIFGRTKRGVEKLHEALQERGFTSVSIHGNKNQGQRQRALQSFKKDQAQIMVATDVAARGLDIPDVSHVINYDIPENRADYIHRIGRTGRANKKGKALTFIQGI